MGNAVIYRPAYDAEVDYLESDGNSYIDTGLKASSELGILAHIQNSNGGQNWLFGGGNAYSDSEYGFLANYSQSYSYFYFNDRIIGKRLLYTQQIELNGDKNVMLVGSDVYSATSATFTSNNNVYLFAHNRGGSQVSKSTGVRIYDFKIYQNSTLVRDFIPVRIGQVGYMYDKVTKQLFANKGTGNFILGNDVSNAVIPQQRCVLYFGNQRSVVYERIYEEYEWLVGDIPAGISMMKLPIGTYNISYNVKYDRIANTTLFETDNDYRYFNSGNSHITAVWDINNSVTVIQYNSNTFTTDTIIPIAGNAEMLYINNQEVTKYGNAISNVVFRSGSNYGNTISYTSSITVDGIERYIPCKLLQPIPAILDGNGIARAAGICGMWDKVSNRFYGNVASRGSFTVSND